jgi:hypothetical protein
MASFLKKDVAWPPRASNSVTVSKWNEVDVGVTPHSLLLLLEFGILITA